MTNDIYSYCKALRVSIFLANNTLTIYGKCGTGKSHLASAICVEVCMQGKKVKFYGTASLVNELIDSKSKETLVALLSRLSKVAILICD